MGVGSGAADSGTDDAVVGNSAGVEHSSGYFAVLASTRTSMDEEEEGAGAHPPSSYEEELSCIMGTASIISGAGQLQLRLLQSPVPGATPDPRIQQSSVSGAATSSTTVLRLQRIADMRLDSEGINVISEQTMQLIDKLTQQQQSQHPHRSRHLRSRLGSHEAS